MALPGLPEGSLALGVLREEVSTGGSQFMHALKIGEELTVTFTPARNGSPLGGLKTIKRADGTVLGNTGGN